MDGQTRRRVRARAVLGPRRARVLVSEGGDRPLRHGLRRRPEGARLRSTRTPFPETYELWKAIEARYDTTIEVSPASRLRTDCGSGTPTSTSRRRKVEPLNRALLDLDCWITGSAGRLAVADARRRAEARLGTWSSTSCGRQTRSPTGRTTGLLDVHPRARGIAIQLGAARSGLRLDRRHSFHAARKGARGTRAGTERTECGLQHERTPQGIRHLVHRPVGRRQDDYLEHRRAGARAPRPPCRAPRRRHRAHAPLQTASASRRRTATSTSRGSAGSRRASRAPAPPSSADFAVMRRCGSTRASLVEQHGLFIVEIHAL